MHRLGMLHVQRSQSTVGATVRALAIFVHSYTAVWSLLWHATVVQHHPWHGLSSRDLGVRRQVPFGLSLPLLVSCAVEQLVAKLSPKGDDQT